MTALQDQSLHVDDKKKAAAFPNGEIFGNVKCGRFWSLL